MAHGHVIRANEDPPVKIGLNVEVNRKQPKGRPMKWWHDTLDGDLKASQPHPS